MRASSTIPHCAARFVVLFIRNSDEVCMRSNAHGFYRALARCSLLVCAACAPHLTLIPTPSPTNSTIISLLPGVRDTTVAIEVVELPPNFRGTALVIYGQESGLAGVRKGDSAQYDMPRSGVLRVRPPEPWGYTSMLVRTRGGLPIGLLASCDDTFESDGASSTRAAGCWLPRVLLNVPNAPAYVAFFIGPRDRQSACKKYGITTIEHVIYGEPSNNDAALRTLCHEAQTP